MEKTKNGTPEHVQEEDFAQLLEQSLITGERIKPGDRIEAMVVKITPEWTFIDLGGKSEGVIDSRELQDESGAFTVSEGDRIKAYFLSQDNNEKLFSIKLGAGSAGKEQLENAFGSGVPVEGSVVREVKGGFEVKLAGSPRAFCPFSQMSLRRVDNAEEYIGRKLPFKITEFNQNGRNIVLSHRALLEEERREQKEALRNSLQEGMVITGTVTSVRDFGAFVDIGGIEGLIPVSEIGWGRTDKAADVLAAGQEVKAKVLSIDWEKDRFSFSMKALLPDPWESAATLFPEGSVHDGTVVRLAKFGAFVSVAPGVEGLVHISRLGGGKRLAHPGEAVSEGETLRVTIESIDVGKHRMSLTPVAAAPSKPAADDERSLLKKYVKKPSQPIFASESLGTLGDVLKAKLARKP